MLRQAQASALTKSEETVAFALARARAWAYDGLVYNLTPESML